MSLNALFDAVRAILIERTGKGLTQAEVDRINAALAPVPANDAGGGLIDPARFAVWAPKAIPHTPHALQSAANANGFSGTVLAHWLGQMYVESAGFSVMSENLNYSAEALKTMFGRHRISLADADRYGRKPGQPANQEMIANTLYGGEWGKANLGNTEPGDGWRFRGSGFKQITGRANTIASGFSPEELRTDPAKSAKAAAEFFIRAGCVTPAQRDDVEAVTRKVNGGVNGLDDRIIRTRQAKEIVR